MTYLRAKLLLEVYLIGILSIAMISLNTWQISHEKLEAAVLVQIGISYMWCLGVKSIAQGNWITRAVYVAGCATGQLVGLGIAKMLWR